MYYLHGEITLPYLTCSTKRDYSFIDKHYISRGIHHKSCYRKNVIFFLFQNLKKTQKNLVIRYSNKLQSKESFLQKSRKWLWGKHPYCWQANLFGSRTRYSAQDDMSKIALGKEKGLLSTERNGKSPTQHILAMSKRCSRDKPCIPT